MSAQEDRDASLVRAGQGWSLLVGGRSYDVSFGEPPANGGELIVYVDGRAVPVEARPKTAAAYGGSARKASRASNNGGSATGAAQVVAPMPGRVVKVLVKKGDRVAARQGVVVVEAMKMENELRSPRDGVVTDVKVAEGALVEARAVLVVVE